MQELSDKLVSEKTEIKKGLALQFKSPEPSIQKGPRQGGQWLT